MRYHSDHEYIKQTDQSFPRVDLFVPLMCYDLSDLGFLDR